MNFHLSAEQRMVRKVVRDFAEKEVAPTAAERDEQERFDRRLFEKIAELGLTGILWSGEEGGSADYLSYCLAIEELSRVCASTGVMLSVHVSLASWPLSTFGTEEQKRKFLLPLIEGKKLGAFGLTEAGSGSDAAALKSTALRQGDHYLLNGSKMFVTNGGEADLYLIFALTDPSKKHKGISAFLVEKEMAGFQIGKKEKKMGIRSSPTTELHFQNVQIPLSHRLGEEGEGFRIALRTLDGGRTGIAAQAVGIAQGALEQALAYAKSRKQFGKPIMEQQAVQTMLADMSTQIEAARLLTYRAAWLEGAGQAYSQASAMAKLFASDMCMQVTTDAVQIFGGYGYMRDYPVERLMRDAKITQIYEGTNQIQRLVIAKFL